MPAPRAKLPTRLAVHALLIAGAALFAAPLLWMLLSSAKLPREMAGEKVRLLPAFPRQRNSSPYLDEQGFVPPEKPEGVEQADWESAERSIGELIDRRLLEWKSASLQRLPELQASWYGPDGSLHDGIETPFHREMVKGCFDLLTRRLDDVSRAGGAEAIVKGAGRILDDDALTSIWDTIHREFRVGDVRVRTRNLEEKRIGASTDWRYETGPVNFERWGNDSDTNARTIRYDFGVSHYGFREGRWIAWLQSKGFLRSHRSNSAPLEQITLSYTPETADSLKEADRVYVALHGDESWNAVDLEVVARGRLYRTSKPFHIMQRDWFEVELRFPEDLHDPLEPRSYLLLDDVRPAPAARWDFIRLTIHQGSPLGAWWAKATRAYAQAFREVPFARFMATSFSLCLLNIVLSILSCTLVGYAFARLEWPGRDVCFAVLLATMMLPPQVTMIPQFIIFKSLGWYNTLLPLWVPAAFGTPFFIFLVRQFFKNVPKDLEEAARIDGCGFLRIYWHVMMPLVRPVVATIAIFTFLGTWNNFMGPLIYLNDERLFPLALGLFRFQLRGGEDATLMMAGSVLMTIPVLILFASLQRVFVQGIALSGTKA